MAYEHGESMDELASSEYPPESSPSSRETGTFRKRVGRNEAPFLSISQDEEHHVGLWRNIILVDFRGRIEGPMLRAIRSAVGQALLRHPEGVGLVFIAEEGCRPPAIGLRDEMLAMRQETCDRTLAIGYVIRFDGFVASALRGAITGTQIIARSQFPEKVFKQPEQAANWLAPQCGLESPFDQQRLKRMLKHVLR